MSDPKTDLLAKKLEARKWTAPRRRGSWRTRLGLLASAAVALLAVAYLGGAMGSQGGGELEPVVEGPPPTVSASGPVVPERRARLSFTMSGRLRTISVRAGDQVRQGQVLAQLEPSSVQAAPSAGGAPASAELYITAPFDGVVGQVHAREWETVTPGSPVVTVGDARNMRVEIEDLSETEVGRLQVGQPAEVTFEAFKGRKVAGRVARISPMNNSKGGGVNYDVVVDFAEADLPPFRWGMTAHVEILVEPRS